MTGPAIPRSSTLLWQHSPRNGYDATNMDDIAARAGVGKAAIYRRWSSKAALITDTLVYWRPDLLTNDAPDTGSLAGDLEALVERVGRNENDLITTDVCPGPRSPTA